MPSKPHPPPGFGRDPKPDAHLIHGQFVSSTQTADLFLGGRRKSWMLSTTTSPLTAANASTTNQRSSDTLSTATPAVTSPTGVLSPARSDGSEPSYHAKRAQDTQNTAPAKRPRSEEIAPFGAAGTRLASNSSIPPTTTTAIAVNGPVTHEASILNDHSSSTGNSSLAQNASYRSHLGQVSPRPYYVDSSLVDPEASRRADGDPNVGALTFTSHTPPPAASQHGQPIVNETRSNAGQHYGDSIPRFPPQGFGDVHANPPPLSPEQPRTNTNANVIRQQPQVAPPLHGKIGKQLEASLDPEIRLQICFVNASYPKTSPYFSQNCRLQFENFASTCSKAPAKASPDILSFRMKLMRDAVQFNDHCFLILHQIICMHSQSEKLVPQPLRIAKLLHPAMIALNRLLGPTSDLDPVARKWFSEFPITIQDFSFHFPDIYQPALASLRCIFRFFPSWESYNQICLGRGCPPLVRELITCLGISSPVLMEAVFTYCLQSLWGPEDNVSKPYMVQARDVFKRNLNLFLSGENRTVASFCALDEKPFISKYRELHGAYVNARASFFSIPATVDPGIQIDFSGPPVLMSGQTPQSQANGYPSGKTKPVSQASNGTRPLARYFSELNSYLSHDTSKVSNREYSGASNMRNVPSPTHPGTLVPPFGAITPRSPSLPRSESAQQTNNLSMNMTPHPRQAQLPVTFLGIPPSASTNFLPHQVAAAHRAAPADGTSTTQNPPLIPQPGDRLPQPRVPTWTTSALHQAHLQSPILCPVDSKLSTSDATLYRFVSSLPVPPLRLDKNNDVMHFMDFELSPQEFINVSRTTAAGEPHATRTLNPDSCQYRIRCCKLLSNGDEITEAEWFGAEISFPEFASLKLNGTYLEVRRKVHFSKDLPVDISDMLRPGKNRLEVYLNVAFNDRIRASYGIAVECITGLIADDIKDRVRNQSLDAAVVLQSIKSSLNPTANSLVGGNDAANDDPDDDIVMLSRNLTIGVLDPISLSAVGPTPTRGSDCKHHECFDLDTFLESRERTPRPKIPYKVLGLPTNNTTHPDVWKCPICRGDARPHKLRLDKWMLDVRDELEKSGKLGESKIVVEADGTWRVKYNDKGPASHTNTAKQAAAKVGSAADSASPKLNTQASPENRITNFQVILDSDDDME